MARIYVDFDDVLCDTALYLLKLLRECHGRELAFEDIGSFNLEQSFGLTRPQVDDLMDLAHAPEHLMAVAPLDGARDALRAWAAADHEVIIVTGRPPTTEHHSRAWLERHSFPYTAILFVDKYARFPQFAAQGAALSLQDLARHSFALGIDDSLTMARFLVGEMNLPTILFDRPWNRAVPPPELAGARRCRGWSETRRQVERMLFDKPGPNW